MSSYPHALKYFMWPWQVYFRISCQTTAESLFNELDRGLNPNVFLIGFLLEKVKSNSPPICIDPEDIGYPLEGFQSIKELANQFYLENEDKDLFHTGEGVQEEVDSGLKVKSHKEALQKLLNESIYNTEKICFVAMPVIVKNYSVYVVLELNRRVYESHLHLKKQKWDRFTIFRSLVESTVDAYVSDMRRNLFMPDPGKNLGDDFRSTESLLKEAALKFTHTASVNGANVRGIHGLFKSCNEISISKYEKMENTGYLLIAEKDHSDIETTLKLEMPFPLHDYRKTRKLLQLTNNDNAVICNSFEVFGLGKIKKNYDPSTESIFSIRFKGVHCWDLQHDKNILFQMRYGLPLLYREALSKGKIFSDAQRIFPEITLPQLENLYVLFMAATNQKKGAMLVVSNAAKDEAVRLKKQCICIQPVLLTSELILNLTSIDGGLLLDISGYAYAQGVILDGIVGEKGDAARGSRYNSAITYHEYHGKSNSIMIVVVSEDGMIDVIPTLLPQIKHSDILEMIGLLEELNSKDKFDRGVFDNAMQWLQNRKFYLLLEECDKINSLRTEIEKKDKGTNLRIVYDDFHPNKEMNKSYYID
jgi:DisA bacterial checkpoint controller nucleotide-binding